MAPSIAEGVGNAAALAPASPDPAPVATSAHPSTSADQPNGHAETDTGASSHGSSDGTADGADSASDCSASPDPHEGSEGNATTGAGEAAGPGLDPEGLPGPVPADEGLALLLGEGALARALAGDAVPYEPLPETEEERDAFEAEFAAALASLGPIGGTGGDSRELEQAEAEGEEEGEEEGLGAGEAGAWEEAWEEGAADEAAGEEEAGAGAGAGVAVAGGGEEVAA